MLEALLLGAVIGLPQGGTQAPQRPIFHGEAYVVTWQISFQSRDLRKYHGLTSANFQATTNKNSIALDVAEDPKRPGHYLLSINPPLELRDGKTHQIDIQYRLEGDKKWRDFPAKWTPVFEKPRDGEGRDLQQVAPDREPN